MRNSIGNNVVLTLSGESHGPYVSAVLDGMSAGIPVDEEFIASQLSKRRPSGVTDTGRVEPDAFSIVSGVFNGFTTGSPITVLIPNENADSSVYERSRFLPRPSHADYVAYKRYEGFEDYRGGGHFSGRLTAGIVAAGAIALKALEGKGIRVATHILSCSGVRDASFCDFEKEMELVDSRSFPVIDEGAGEKMIAGIEAARKDGDSVGGIIQTAIVGVEAGLGEPWFSSLDGSLANAMFSLGGVKGVSFGAGFGLAQMCGSQANDPFRMNGDRVVTATNNSGGVNGGLSNGMPIVFDCAVKPTPSIPKEQRTVDVKALKDSSLLIEGRHDPAIIRRICIVATSLAAIVLCDMLALKSAQDALR